MMLLTESQLLKNSDTILLIIFPFVFLIILLFCWRSTSTVHLSYNLWLIQLQRTSQRRIVRILSMMMEHTTQNLEQIPPNNGTDQVVNPTDGESNGQTETTNLLVIRTPSSVLEQDMPNQILDQINGRAESSGRGMPLMNENNNIQQQIFTNIMDDNTLSNTRAQGHQPTESSTELLTIRLKFLDDTQSIVQVQKDITVGTFKRKYFGQHLATGKVVRLIFQGRLLRDDFSTLISYGLHDQCVIHCHIGTRPYSSLSSPNDQNQTNRNGAEQGNAGQINGTNTLGARFFRASWLDLDTLMIYIWRLIMIAWEWANRAEEVPPEDRSLFIRAKERIRLLIRIFLDILFGSFIRSANSRRQNDDVRYNIGHLLVLLVFVKFILLWSFVLLYPQFTDRRSIFLLIMLTATTGFYFYFNRANIQQNRRENSEG